MRTIIIGCGRVGAALAVQLSSEGHDAQVIDRDPDSRRLLPAAFHGGWHVGNGFSRAVLQGAGVDHADAVVAVTTSDNANIVAARIAKEVYRVPQVVARVYEPRRAAIYRNLAIPTLSSVVWAVAQIHQMLLYPRLAAEQRFGNGETVLVRSTLPDYLTGRRMAELEVEAEIRVVEITRSGRSFLPAPATALAEGDDVSFAVASSSIGRLQSFLGRELGS